LYGQFAFDRAASRAARPGRDLLLGHAV